MSPVNWDTFEGLPGATESNFEALCRALIRRHYARYGVFRALAAQPGVEFHLKLQTRCPTLGEPGRWYGWQCRWYDLPGGRAIGPGRREKIRKAIATTEKVLPDLTDWILWTRRPLTSSDQAWFYGLKTQMRLQMWTSSEVEEHLSGDAEILRSTYFGELVLTPDALADLHDTAVAPIRTRWQPELHQVIDAERELRRMLAEPGIWNDLQQTAEQLELCATQVDGDLSGLEGPLAGAANEVPELARAAAAVLADIHSALYRGDLDLLRQQLATRPALSAPQLTVLPRQLRARRHHSALSITNALANVGLARSLLDDVDDHLASRLIAVLADAGNGKTQLAAQLTAATGNRPAGVLLHGRDLNAGDNLDTLAQRVTIGGAPVASMEALAAAVDAAGRRAQRRIPIVIDGLSEAEDPRDWKGPLGTLHVTLREYPYVLVVCTLRTQFADEALPPDVARLEIPGFDHDIVSAVRRYFSHFKIDPVDAELPLDLLSHPLTLRLFCEVTNPKRDRVVGIEVMPGSLSALFDRSLEQAAERIAELAPRTWRYYIQNVRTAFDEIGLALWEEKTRTLDFGELRRRLGDDLRPWNESIVNALEQEGVLLRDSGDKPAVSVAYDPLAGHLAANAVLTMQGRAGLEKWLGDPATVDALSLTSPDRHPLAEDTFFALVGLVPRRLHRQQLWQMLGEPLRTKALLGAADLESAYLDAETVQELASLVTEPPGLSRDLFDRLWDTRGSPVHPLNAEFLDAILRPMAVADRDLRWTEWVRRRSAEILEDLQRLEKQWRRTTGKSQLAERLRARWVMWTLTSTVRQLRDQATRTLYWFGRRDPAALFELTVDGLGINDPSVPERLLAASYGVAMAHQLPDQEFAEVLSTYLVALRDALKGPAAAYPTSHWLSRLYVQGTVSLAQTYHSDAVPDGLRCERLSFAPGSRVDPIRRDDPRAEQVGQTLHMDFLNYTLGRLSEGRANYDIDHVGHQAAVAHACGTVWALGWREDGLGQVDETLNWYESRGNRPPTERYGKKYGWIGFYTYAGMLCDDGQLTIDERLSDLHIDPSFPNSPPPASVEVPLWARPTPKKDSRWIREGVVNVPDNLLYRPDLGSLGLPWIAVNGDLQTEGQTPGRRVFGILTALLVGVRDADRLVGVLNTIDRPGNLRLPEVPTDYHTFAGEIPWSPGFARVDEDEDAVRPYRELVPVAGGEPIEVEILTHGYGWEPHDSALNEAGGALVPSRAFSAAFDLHGVPGSFSQTEPDGTVAAVSLGAPAGYSGHILYLREDLVLRYAAGRRLIWLFWGERQLYPYLYTPPKWLINAQQSQADVWRHIRRIEDLSKEWLC